METVGLIINVIGALLLAVSADIQATIFNTLINRVANDKFGTYGMESIPPKFKDTLEKKQKNNKRLNILGYILFGVGAILQLLSIIPL